MTFHIVFYSLTLQGIKGDRGPPGGPGDKGDKVYMSFITHGALNELASGFFPLIYV